MIKAINTAYKGYRFRSRLEARWAVYLDEIGVPYTYEVEGFELPTGRYLPDFYLTGVGAYLEIKPHLGPGELITPEPWEDFEPFYEPGIRERALVTELMEATGKVACIGYGDPFEAMHQKYHTGIVWLPDDTPRSVSWPVRKALLGGGHSFAYTAAVKARSARFERGVRV